MLAHDLDLNRAQLQALSSRDALAAFFAALGYDTNTRLVQQVHTMGIANENLKAAITHIERVASEDAGLFEVYLFEMKAVTMALTQALVRSFRNRPGDYLLVLIDLRQPYERLDFVLVQRYSSASPQNTPPDDASAELVAAPKQVGVYPRILTVQRRTPSMVALRILRRFSNTESDTFAQYEKLLSAYDTADWSEQYFNNRALFSDYYLTQRLPQAATWQQAERNSALVRGYQQLRTLYTDVRALTNTAATIRVELLEPTFTLLGFRATRGKARSESPVTPTYLLYAQDAAADAQPAALCLAYRWGRNLDGRDDRDEETPDENPGANVVTLLDSGLAPWAIVTNGKIWRLYAAKAHSRATNYYEIDLEETLVLPDAERATAYMYFWLFFRAAAFGRDASNGVGADVSRPSFLDALLAESEKYARQLGENLKNRVFDEIFLYFAKGFLAYARRNDLLPAWETLAEEERQRTLEPFFSGTLTFLYRLLFLLYAESRDLLPVREEIGYGQQSLEQLKREIAERARNVEGEAAQHIKNGYGAMSTGLYERLQALFAAVDRGNAALNVPVYNGGLFMTHPDAEDSSAEAQVARFLATHKIPDRELALGLDRMARDVDEKTQELVFIDYKSLGVRQLGSIYEGLLEFKLHIAPEKMAYVKGKKTEEIVPYAEAVQKKLTILRDGRGKDAGERSLARGDLYLENDRRERKATGSYYTPDYIVKYIVEQTVGPVLKQRLEILRPFFREAEQLLRSERNKAEALKKQRLIAKSNVAPEQSTYIQYSKLLNRQFFDLRVLDPAMGSGHFLVEAVDYITDQMAKFLTAFKWSPVLHELALTRSEIQEEMERQGVTIDSSKLTDLNLLKRRVLKSCIYGVDLNQMAVELAKVSLWLDCFTLGAPLSFLDHHMKCGNSLIGGNVAEVQKLLSSGLWSNQFAYLLDATQLMRRVSERADITASEVAESRREYHRAADALAPFKHLLNTWLSDYFGVKGGQQSAAMCTDAILSGQDARDGHDREVIAAAAQLAREKKFFHWELEFPEVFFDGQQRKPDGGFDAVVGNPPYDVLEKEENELRTEDLEQLVHYLQQSPVFSIAFGGKINIFRFFIALYKVITQKSGYQGYIVPIGLITDRGCLGLRQLLLQEESVLKINLFPERYDPERRVFQDAKVSPCIVIAKCSGPTNNFILTIHDGKLLESVSATHQVNAKDIKIIDPETLAFPQVSEEIWKVATKVHNPQSTVYLKDVAVVGGGEIHLTYYKSCFTSDQTKRLMYRGAEIGRYLINDELSQGEKLYLDVARCAEQKLTVKDFKQRIALQRITGVEDKRRLIGTLIDGGISLAHTVQFIISSSVISTSYLAALFNSKLLDMRFRVTSGTSNVGVYELSYLPIRRINFVLSEQERAYYREKARLLYEQCVTKGDQQCALGFVEHHLELQPEQSDVVHDLLAMLAEEMLRLNREKRAAMQSFLGELTETLKLSADKDGRIGLETLTGKSRLLDYAGDYQKNEPAMTFAELQEILRKNRTKLGISLSDTHLPGRVEERYAASLERVLPLKEQLRQTDELIDQVVYKLYGLTEEEVRVVEGK